MIYLLHHNSKNVKNKIVELQKNLEKKVLFLISLVNHSNPYVALAD
uniref:Uncharacterized protein n=1 Tax=Plesiomonas shigelloides TaxID=703 RepID=A0A4D6U7L8_PLESH|nr:hypothetical protein [Plesiomonas shigelloides]